MSHCHHYAHQLKVKVSPTLNLNECVLAIVEKCNHLIHLKQLQSFLITVGHAHTQFYAFKLVRFRTLKLNNLNYARFIFDHLRSPNVFLYTAMLTAYASQPHLTSAFTLYRHMLRGGKPKPNQFIYPNVLRCNGTKWVRTRY
ncbi:hypothetical protein CFOL_v3_03222 [Cephalotus follicularis]|uniref:PPR domain-containing protein n=1 Tax=Cephalotus follicularis TaxID=3775 RepID=A0A1Q3AVD7_CEPFO|nr:hypothetical protein CFOL_v3_03222 [Cephalotus follicularis]